jgi:hypothetical protein
MALAKGGLCDLLFGGGMFEFRAGSLVGMESNGSGEQELDRVEYRGDARSLGRSSRRSGTTLGGGCDEGRFRGYHDIGRGVTDIDLATISPATPLRNEM